MKRLAIAAFLIAPMAIAMAQVVPQPGPPTPVACAYNTTPVTLTDGQAGWVQCDNKGSVVVSLDSVSAAPTYAPVAPATATATKSELIGCQATSAAINPTTGQQAAIDCDLNNNVLVSAGGAPNFTTGQVTVTTSNTATVAARALRRSVTITNITGTQQLFCSGTTATAGNGQLIPAVVGANFTVSTTAAINCIAITASQTVSVAETY